MDNIKSSTRISVWLAAIAVLVVGTLAPGVAQAGEWSVDGPHTEINFSIKHFFTPVTGSFSDFDIDLNYDPEHPAKSSVTVRIGVASIDTGNERRDGHLRSGDWFETDKHPDMTFESTSVAKISDSEFVAHGSLTIKGESHEIELPITLLGVKEIPEEMQAMFGGTKVVSSFRASTAIDRGDYGVGVGNWAATLVVGGEVSIEILLEAHRK